MPDQFESVDEGIDEALPFPPFGGPIGGGRLPFFQGDLGRGRGVQTARLETPRGSATLRLPEQVVTQQAFKEATEKLEKAINALSGEVATNKNNISVLQRGQTGIRADVAKTNAAVKGLKDDFTKFRKQQSSNSTMSLLTTLMLQQDAERRLQAHHHLTDGSVDPRSLPAQNNMLPLLLMLPMMSGEGAGATTGDESSSNMMMMMVLMLGFMK